MNTSGENLIQKDIEQEMKDAYLDYSMSVIASRALPDVRDGLKPVHRRILYTMYGNGLYPEREFRKCADTVGNVLGQYHPHGDAGSLPIHRVEDEQNFHADAHRHRQGNGGFSVQLR